MFVSAHKFLTLRLRFFHCSLPARRVQASKGRRAMLRPQCLPVRRCRARSRSGSSSGRRFFTGRSGQRALDQFYSRYRFVAVICVHPVHDARGFMLQFDGTAVCDSDHQSAAVFTAPPSSCRRRAARPADPFRLAVGRQVLRQQFHANAPKFRHRRSRSAETPLCATARKCLCNWLAIIPAKTI